MKKKVADQRPVAELQPDELNELRRVVLEFVERVQNVDNEIELLKEDRKSLIEDYSEKLDMVTLQAALKVLKIQSKVDRKDTFDAFIEVLSREESV